MPSNYTFEQDCISLNLSTHFSIRDCFGSVKWPSYPEGKKRPKEETDHFRFVGGKFNKHENLHTKLV